MPSFIMLTPAASISSMRSQLVPGQTDPVRPPLVLPEVVVLPADAPLEAPVVALLALVPLPMSLAGPGLVVPQPPMAVAQRPTLNATITGLEDGFRTVHLRSGCRMAVL
jgi:hypothetical protein